MPLAALSLLHLCHLSRRDGEISMRLLHCSGSPQPGDWSLPKPSLLRAAFPSTAGYETSVREKPGPDAAAGCCDNGLFTAFPGPHGFCFELLLWFFPCFPAWARLWCFACCQRSIPAWPGGRRSCPDAAFPWQSFPRVFSPGSWRAPPHRKFWLHHYCGAYCLGQGQDSGLLTSSNVLLC